MNVKESNQKLIERHWPEMVRRAIAVRDLAFCPYSKFKVGAALLTWDGMIFDGCNVENASYGLSICAERTAVVKAVSGGFSKFAAIAVVADPLATPCGACRQFLFQFGTDIVVRSFSPADVSEFQEWTTAELLPDGFRF